MSLKIIRLFLAITTMMTLMNLTLTSAQAKGLVIKDINQIPFSGEWWGESAEIYASEMSSMEIEAEASTAGLTSLSLEKYRLEVVAHTGQSNSSGSRIIEGLGWGPSINDNGQVAFKASISDGTEAVFVWDDQALTEISAFSNEFYYNLGSSVFDVNLNYWFGDAVQINNQGQVVWRENPRDGEIGFIVRQGLTYGDFKLVAKTHYPYHDSISPFESFDPVNHPALFSWVTMTNKVSNQTRVVFPAIPLGDYNRTLLATPVDTETGGHSYDTDYHLWGNDDFLGLPDIFPMIADNNVTVFRLGGNYSDNLAAFLNANMDTAYVIAQEPDYIAIGARPGISDDSRMITFMADHASFGVGIFGKPGPSTLVKIAGIAGDGILDPGEEWNDDGDGIFEAGEDEGLFETNGTASPFSLTPRVGVNRTFIDGNTDYTVVYLANGRITVPGQMGPKGLYVSIVDRSDPYNCEVSDPLKVVEVGDTIDGLDGTVNNINLYDPVNSKGQIVFWVQTTAGEKAIVRAVPGGRVIWQSGQSIQNAVIEAYYLKGTSINDAEAVVIPPAVSSNPTKSDVTGRFVIPSEFFDAPLGDGEIDGKRGIRVKVTYKDITDQDASGTEYTIINYPDWDPFYPFRRTGLASDIVFPNPVFFQPGAGGAVNISHEDSDGKWRIFLNLDSGVTNAEIITLAKSYTQADANPDTWSEEEWTDYLKQWVQLKRGVDPKTRIPSFVFFTIPSKQTTGLTCARVTNDNVSWGYNNCFVQNDGYMGESFNAIQMHFEQHIKPQMTDLSPNDVDDVPFNITAHSLGGVISRDWLARREKEGNPYPKIDHYVTFDAPHGGMKFENFFYEGFRTLARVFLNDFWSEAYMNGTASGLDEASNNGWNKGRDLLETFNGTDTLLLSSPNDGFITPEEDPRMEHGVTWSGTPGTAWGVGRVIKKINFPFLTRFSSTPNGYCERYVNGWQLAVKNAIHSIQTYTPSMLSAARFLAYGDQPTIGTKDKPLDDDFRAVFGAGSGDQCLDAGSAEEVRLAVFKKDLTASAGGVSDETIYFDMAETLHVEGLLNHDGAQVVVLSDLGQEMARTNEEQKQNETGMVAFAYNVAVSQGTGTLRLIAGSEDALAENITISYGNHYYAAIGTKEARYSAEDTVDLRLQLMNWSDQVVYGTGGAALVSVIKPDATQVTVNLYDDGTHGDDVAGDGIYSGQFFDTSEQGRYLIQGDVTIELAGGVFARRSANSFVVIDTVTQSVSSGAVESASDDDGNGLIDGVDVTYNINFSNGTGNFALQADVKDGLDVVYHLKRVFDVTSDPSTQAVTFRIPAEIFRKEDTGGPLMVTNVELYDSNYSLYMNSFADYTTAVYSVSDFELPPMPAITYCMPSYGDRDGGYTVLIHGKNLDSVMQVYFGNQSAPSFEIVSDDVISAVVPVWGGGKEDVLIKVVDPWHEATRTGIFEYQDVNHPPVINAVSDKIVNPDHLLQFVISASDPDADPLTLSVRLEDGDDLSTIGAVFTDIGNGTGVFSWTPDASQLGLATNVVFTAIDSGYLSDSTTAMISVEKPVPHIDFVVPTSARIGDQITINGLDFGLVNGSANFDSRADINSDGFVNMIDFAEFSRWWQAQGEDLRADLNHNGIVNLEDYQIFTSAWLSRRGSNYVVFGNHAVGHVVSWDNNQIIVEVPFWAESGPVKVVTFGGESNTVNFTVNPTITGLVPAAASVGDEVALTGYAWGEEQDTLELSPADLNADGEVDVADYVMFKKYWRMAHGRQKIKNSPIDFIHDGRVDVKDRIFFVKEWIKSYRQPKQYVVFSNNAKGEIFSWEKDRIIVKVPKNAKSGKMYVQSGRKNSNLVNFIVESPVRHRWEGKER